mmetsp:Transcript_30690/g.5538  ORF Transcript_30690/g.5538 Transcript_30690/m.5538 type:complete len:159 (-) Transcript_30690:632-1108(-)
MIYLIIKAILPFIIILIFTIFATATIYWVIFFDEVEAFRTIQLSFRTIFDFSIGNVDFSVFPEETGAGMWITIVWVFVSTISLLNIMIALLSNEFEDVISTTNAYYLSFVHNIWYYNRHIPGYGGIVSLPTPLNCLLISAVPFYFLNFEGKYFIDRAL